MYLKTCTTPGDGRDNLSVATSGGFQGIMILPFQKLLFVNKTCNYYINKITSFLPQLALPRSEEEKFQIADQTGCWDVNGKVQLFSPCSNSLRLEKILNRISQRNIPPASTIHGGGSRDSAYRTFQPSPQFLPDPQPLLLLFPWPLFVKLNMTLIK